MPEPVWQRPHSQHGDVGEVDSYAGVKTVAVAEPFSHALPLAVTEKTMVNKL